MMQLYGGRERGVGGVSGAGGLASGAATLAAGQPVMYVCRPTAAEAAAEHAVRPRQGRRPWLCGKEFPAASAATAGSPASRRACSRGRSPSGITGANVATSTTWRPLAATPYLSAVPTIEGTLNKLQQPQSPVLLRVISTPTTPSGTTVVSPSAWEDRAGVWDAYQQQKLQQLTARSGLPTDTEFGRLASPGAPIYTSPPETTYRSVSCGTGGGLSPSSMTTASDSVAAAAARAAAPMPVTVASSAPTAAVYDVAAGGIAFKSQPTPMSCLPPVSTSQPFSFHPAAVVAAPGALAGAAPAGASVPTAATPTAPAAPLAVPYSGGRGGTSSDPLQQQQQPAKPAAVVATQTSPPPPQLPPAAANVPPAASTAAGERRQVKETSDEAEAATEEARILEAKQQEIQEQWKQLQEQRKHLQREREQLEQQLQDRRRGQRGGDETPATATDENTRRGKQERGDMGRAFVSISRTASKGSIIPAAGSGRGRGMQEFGRRGSLSDFDDTPFMRTCSHNGALSRGGPGGAAVHEQALPCGATPSSCGSLSQALIHDLSTSWGAAPAGRERLEPIAETPAGGRLPVTHIDSVANMLPRGGARGYPLARDGSSLSMGGSLATAAAAMLQQQQQQERAAAAARRQQRLIERGDSSAAAAINGTQPHARRGLYGRHEALAPRKQFWNQRATSEGGGGGEYPPACTSEEPVIQSDPGDHMLGTLEHLAKVDAKLKVLLKQVEQQTAEVQTYYDSYKTAAAVRTALETALADCSVCYSRRTTQLCEVEKRLRIVTAEDLTSCTTEELEELAQELEAGQRETFEVPEEPETRVAVDECVLVSEEIETDFKQIREDLRLSQQMHEALRKEYKRIQTRVEQEIHSYDADLRKLAAVERLLDEKLRKLLCSTGDTDYSDVNDSTLQDSFRTVNYAVRRVYRQLALREAGVRTTGAATRAAAAAPARHGAGSAAGGGGIGGKGERGAAGGGAAAGGLSAAARSAAAGLRRSAQRSADVCAEQGRLRDKQQQPTTETQQQQQRGGLQQQQRLQLPTLFARSLDISRPPSARQSTAPRMVRPQQRTDDGKKSRRFSCWGHNGSTSVSHDIISKETPALTVQQLDTALLQSLSGTLSLIRARLEHAATFKIEGHQRENPAEQNAEIAAPAAVERAAAEDATEAAAIERCAAYDRTAAGVGFKCRAAAHATNLEGDATAATAAGDGAAAPANSGGDLVSIAAGDLKEDVAVIAGRAAGDAAVTMARAAAAAAERAAVAAAGRVAEIATAQQHIEEDYTPAEESVPATTVKEVPTTAERSTGDASPNRTLVMGTQIHCGYCSSTPKQLADYRVRMTPAHQKSTERMWGCYSVRSLQQPLLEGRRIPSPTPASTGALAAPPAETAGTAESGTTHLETEEKGTTAEDNRNKDLHSHAAKSTTATAARQEAAAPSSKPTEVLVYDALPATRGNIVPQITSRRAGAAASKSPATASPPVRATVGTECRAVEVKEAPTFSGWPAAATPGREIEQRGLGRDTTSILPAGGDATTATRQPSCTAGTVLRVLLQPLMRPLTPRASGRNAGGVPTKLAAEAGAAETGTYAENLGVRHGADGAAISCAAAKPPELQGMTGETPTKAASPPCAAETNMRTITPSPKPTPVSTVTPGTTGREQIYECRGHDAVAKANAGHDAVATANATVECTPEQKPEHEDSHAVPLQPSLPTARFATASEASGIAAPRSYSPAITRPPVHSAALSTPRGSKAEAVASQKATNIANLSVVDTCLGGAAGAGVALHKTGGPKAPAMPPAATAKAAGARTTSQQGRVTAASRTPLRNEGEGGPRSSARLAPLASAASPHRLGTREAATYQEDVAAVAVADGVPMSCAEETARGDSQGEVSDGSSSNSNFSVPVQVDNGEREATFIQTTPEYYSAAEELRAPYFSSSGCSNGSNSSYKRPHQPDSSSRRSPPKCRDVTHYYRPGRIQSSGGSNSSSNHSGSSRLKCSNRAVRQLRGMDRRRKESIRNIKTEPSSFEHATRSHGSSSSTGHMGRGLPTVNVSRRLLVAAVVTSQGNTCSTQEAPILRENKKLEQREGAPCTVAAETSQLLYAELSPQQKQQQQPRECRGGTAVPSVLLPTPLTNEILQAQQEGQLWTQARSRSSRSFSRETALGAAPPVRYALDRQERQRNTPSTGTAATQALLQPSDRNEAGTSSQGHIETNGEALECVLKQSVSAKEGKASLRPPSARQPRREPSPLKFTQYFENHRGADQHLLLLSTQHREGTCPPPLPMPPWKVHSSYTDGANAFMRQQQEQHPCQDTVKQPVSSVDILGKQQPQTQRQLQSHDITPADAETAAHSTSSQVNSRVIAANVERASAADVGASAREAAARKTEAGRAATAGPLTAAPTAAHSCPPCTPGGSTSLIRNAAVSPATGQHFIAGTPARPLATVAAPSVGNSSTASQAFDNEWAAVCRNGTLSADDVPAASATAVSPPHLHMSAAHPHAWLAAAAALHSSIIMLGVANTRSVATTAPPTARRAGANASPADSAAEDVSAAASIAHIPTAGECAGGTAAAATTVEVPSRQSAALRALGRARYNAADEMTLLREIIHHTATEKTESTASTAAKK